jgi:Mg-chelatase subunit ChlI
VNRVEREGISYAHPAHFILIGTMNPEEGELRPQFLDRFGLCVTVKGLDDIDERREVVRRRLAFESDMRAFTKDWADEEKELTRMIRKARKRLAKVKVPDTVLDRAVRLAAEVKAQGHRADIVMMKAARALAALIGRDEAGPAELAEAARYVLPHRMPNTALASEEALQKQIDSALEKVLANDEPGDAPVDAADAEEVEEAYMPEDMQVPGASAAGSLVFFYLKKKRKSSALTRTR